MIDKRAALAGVLAVWLSGCGSTSYLTPGGGVPIPEITEPEIGAALATEPAVSFPARLMVARVQASGYQGGYGEGRYTVLTTRDVETENDVARLGALPGVAGVGTVSRLFLPTANESAKGLRTAAAQLRGDVLLIYTIDTQFRTEEKPVGPMQVVTLGFLKRNRAHVTATCAAAFIDVRTGFVFGTVEGTATETQRTNAWSSYTVARSAQHAAERAAFDAALDEIDEVWDDLYARYGAPLDARLLQ